MTGRGATPGPTRRPRPSRGALRGSAADGAARLRLGPPGYAPPGYGPPATPPYGYPPPGYGYPWPAVPRGPRRPGQVIASAVLAFVQAAMVFIASLYVWFFASIVTVATAGAPGDLDADGPGHRGDGPRRSSSRLRGPPDRRRRHGAEPAQPPTWLLLVVALAVQVVLSVYWLVRLLPSSATVPAPTRAPSSRFTLFFAAGPLVGLGLVVFGGGRRWFAQDQPAAPPTGGPGVARA